MSAEMQLCVVIATFNERDTLPDLVKEIHQLVPEASILVVDDNSPDGTGLWVRQQAQHDSRLHLLHREARGGLGTATLAGIAQALQQPVQWVATMDADFSHDPADLKRLWQRIQKMATVPAQDVGEFDVLIGSRYVQGGAIAGWTWRRRTASRLVNGFSRWTLGLRTRDCSGALRLYRASALRALDLSLVRSGGFAYLEHLLWILQRSGARIKEHPITFRERRAGKSKVNLRESLRALGGLLRLSVLRR